MKPAINSPLVRLSRTVHIYLSIALLLVLVFFAVTGITLNHPEAFTGNPETNNHSLEEIPELPRDNEGRISPSDELKNFLHSEFGIYLDHAELRYEDEFLVIDYQAPGTSKLVEIDMEFEEIFVEETDYGIVAALNDLHKGRHTDLFWSVLIDLSGILTVIFAIAGFVLLLPSKRRFMRVLKYSAIGIATTGMLYVFIGAV